MSRCTRLTLSVLFCLTCSAAAATAEELKTTLGKQQTIMRSGQHGFNYFPDEPVSVISERPLRFLMVVGNQTFLMEGRSFATAQPVRVVLGPSNKPGAYDEQYAGISSVYLDRRRREILGFFHAEKPTGGKNQEGTFRFYATIALAVSRDGGANFTKVGPILTGLPEDPHWKGTAQGNADVSVTVDDTGKWLYAYYTEHSRRDPANGRQRSVITCMARSAVSDGGRPGTWKKYYNGSFSEPGLGGRDSEVANC